MSDHLGEDPDRLLAFDVAYRTGYPSPDAFLASMTPQQWRAWLDRMRESD